MSNSHENDNAHLAVGEVDASSNDLFPFYPRITSVRGRILGALLRGDHLTQKDTHRRFSDFRLAAQVEALRKSGWAIDREMIEVETRDAGRRSEVARYSLPGAAIEAAGDVGRRFAEAARIEEEQRRSA